MTIAVNPNTGEAVYLTPEGKWEPAKTAVNPQTKETLAFDGQDWKPLSKPSKGVLGHVDDAVRSLASGVTFGFADEISAKMDQLTGRGGSYEENLKKERARDKDIPGAISIPGEIAGGVAGVVAAAPVTGPMAAAAGISRIPQAARNILGGMGAGGLYGAGSAEDSRLSGAGIGAAIGGPVGFAAPHVARGVMGAFNAVRGAVRPQANVAADLGRAIQRDETTPAALMQAVEEAQTVRPGVATVADVGGENVRGLVERIAQTPGAGRTTVVPALTGRQQGQLGRVTNDLQNLTGTRQTATEAVSETMERRATQARPLYDEAMQFEARESPDVVRAWTAATSTGWGQNILRSQEFRRNLQTEYGIANPADAPLMVQIDAWKKAADDIIGDAQRSGAGNRVRVISGMRDSVVSVLDQANPAYARARDAWAGPSRYLTAIDEGRNIFSTKIGGEELSNGLSRMSQAEQEAFRIGAVSAIRAKMGNDPAKLGDMTKYLRSPEMRQKIAAIMPTEEARASWAQRLDFEVSSSELTGRALGNSATARRLAEKQDADSILGDLVMDAFAGTPPIGMLRRMATAVPRRIRDTLRSRSDDILAELLTDPQAMQGLQRALERVQSRGAGPRSGAPAITGANAAINPAFVNPAAIQGTVRSAAEAEQQ